jgi:hypothetical protein
MTRFFVAIAAWVFAIVSFYSLGYAQVTFLPPTPYLSAADSPFDISGLGKTFFLEDFEDGVFDWPPGVTTSGFLVNGPGPLTDSVDADDVAIDGFGTAGHSLMFQNFIVNPTNPPTWNTGIDIYFNEQQLGFLPNVFGFVWTDGMPTSVLSVAVRDGNGQWRAFIHEALMHTNYSGETAEDHFIGIQSEYKITQVSVTNAIRTPNFVNQFEMDHIQFGLIVPEPSAAIIAHLAAISILALLSIRRIGLRKGHGEQEVGLGSGSGLWSSACERT